MSASNGAVAERPNGQVAQPGPVTQIGPIIRVLAQGDLSQLNDVQRGEYYHRVCESVQLNPLTQPFKFLWLGKNDDRKLVMYATKDCAEQLRKRDEISVEIVSSEVIAGNYRVTVRARTPDGRTDMATGAVPLEKPDGEWKSNAGGKRYFAASGTFSPVRGEEACNAIMKAETKAKRRVTLSICGLGFLDESEIESIREAEVYVPAAPAIGDRDQVAALRSELDGLVTEIVALRSAPIANVVARLLSDVADDRGVDVPASLDAADESFLRGCVRWVQSWIDLAKKAKAAPPNGAAAAPANGTPHKLPAVTVKAIETALKGVELIDRENAEVHPCKWGDPFTMGWVSATIDRQLGEEEPVENLTPEEGRVVLEALHRLKQAQAAPKAQGAAA